MGVVMSRFLNFNQDMANTIRANSNRRPDSRPTRGSSGRNSAATAKPTQKPQDKVRIQQEATDSPSGRVQSLTHNLLNNYSPDSNMSTGVSTSSGGFIESNTTAKDYGAHNSTVSANRDRTAATLHDQLAGPEGSDITVSDVDASKNLTGEASADGVNIRNIGAGPGSGSVHSRVNYSEAAGDGPFERLGERGAELFGLRDKKTNESRHFSGASGVTVRRLPEGQTEVLAESGGEMREIFSTPGDTDDTWLEKGGEAVDNFLNFRPGSNRADDPNYRLTRRGYRPVKN